MLRQGFAVASSLFGFAMINYMMVWVSNLSDAIPSMKRAFPSSIDGAPFVDLQLKGPTVAAFNLALLSILPLQHNTMARLGVKARMRASGVPFAWERSVFIAASATALAIILYLWQPMEYIIWQVPPPYDKAVLLVGIVGVVLHLTSVLSNDTLELFGLRQAFMGVDEKDFPPPKFVLHVLYQHVRHPMYAFLLAFLFCTPYMSAGRLLFSLFTLAFVLWSLPLEEANLVAALGEPYERYRAEVPALMPRIKPYRDPAAAKKAAAGAAGKANGAAAAGGGGGKKRE